MELKIPQVLIQYPCSDGWDTQGFHSRHKGLDFGWLKDISKDGMTPIYACDDGEVAFEGFYTQTINGKKYNPIGIIIRHPHWSSEYDYYSIYWHLAQSDVWDENNNKGYDFHVKRGQRIGLKGMTGCSTGVHLHFQIIQVEKGASIPDQHNPSQIDRWGEISIDPTSIIEVYDGQIFKYTGTSFNLQQHKENEEVKTLKAELNAVKSENEALNKMIEIMLDSYLALKGVE